MGFVNKQTKKKINFINTGDPYNSECVCVCVYVCLLLILFSFNNYVKCHRDITFFYSFIINRYPENGFLDSLCKFKQA